MLWIAQLKAILNGEVIHVKHRYFKACKSKWIDVIINSIIFDRLVKGEFNDGDRAAFNEVFGRLGDRGCDAVVMGCTEIPILMDGVDTALPTLDSTRLLARAALAYALA